MNYRSLILNDLSVVRTGSHTLSEIALEVHDFFINHDPSHHHTLTARSFLDAIPLAHTYTQELVFALNYFCNERVPLLEMAFALWDSIENELIPLSYDDINFAEKTGELVNPETGDLIKNYKDKVLVFYHPKSLAKELYAKQ